ncbi:hypothetical protein BDR03DRAFT_158559 [Suillus americanus]|nr:hypothetical protein BDR03DRAFT_158559 [Suillus americanus]
MTIVSDNPIWWPLIGSSRVNGYFTVAAAAVVTYDWTLTFGQEIELIWRQRWSLMTVLYLSVRYLGMLYTVSNVLSGVQTISLTDAVSRIMYETWNWTHVVVFPMLGVIVVARLHAMYQRSRKILISLVITFLAIIIFSGVVTIMQTMHTSGEEVILSGTYQCIIAYAGYFSFLSGLTWIACTVWEVFALCLAVWVTVKHFIELRQHSTGGIIGDCFTVLMKTHIFYFASFVVVSSCDLIGFLSPTVV